MKTVCELNKCAGCMACIDACPKGAIKIEDSMAAYNAVIRTDLCIHCEACHHVCQCNYPIAAEEPKQWYQGWAEREDMRKSGSSGGFASEIARAFIEHGGAVCSCVFEKGEFTFKVTDKLTDLQQFSGSKYVKSNPTGIYKDIRKRLEGGQKVLFIGLPCQVAALKNYVGSKLQELLYTADLICHGTPSPQLLEIFLKQYGYSLWTIKKIQFRVKGKFQVNDNYKGITTTGVCDKYSIAFLNSLTYTENCYNCIYARRERVSDLTLGDSWGSNLPIDEQKKGVSIVLYQNDKGQEILEQARLHLVDVDIEKAVKNNHQLKAPSARPVGRDTFFKGIKKGKSFNRLTLYCYPKQCFRQDVKQILIRMKIIRGT